MPKLDSSMKAVTTANNYRFTATRLQDLGASEYTLVTIITDVSTSVQSYRGQLEACIKAVLGSCRLSPRSDNLMLRLCAFNNKLNELHGFKELRLIADDDYNGIIKVGGCTALYEASFEGIDATAGYGKMLISRGFSANAIVFVITDGASFETEEVKVQAERLHLFGVRVFGIGVGRYLQKEKYQEELLNIASDPDSEHFFTIEAFDDLRTIEDTIVQRTCREPPPSK